jgi:hypothetical protein
MKTTAPIPDDVRQAIQQVWTFTKAHGLEFLLSLLVTLQSLRLKANGLELKFARETKELSDARQEIRLSFLIRFTKKRIQV